MTSWLPIIAGDVPEVIALIAAIAALRKKYPVMTPDQVTALVGTITSTSDAAFDDVLSKVGTDQAKGV